MTSQYLKLLVQPHPCNKATAAPKCEIKVGVEGEFPLADDDRQVRYLEGRVSLDKLISHRMGLAEIGRGFELLASGVARRVVVDLQSGR